MLVSSWPCARKLEVFFSDFQIVVISLLLFFGMQFDKVAVDENEPLLVLKVLLFSLTGVSPERQKILGIKGAVSDDTVLGTN